MRVVHVISGTGVGGAERTLSRLLAAWKSPAEHTVICLSEEGPMAAVMREIGTQVHCLDISRGSRLPVVDGVRLAKLLRRLKPDLIQGWMYHGNLAALASGALAGIPGRVVWNIRNSPRFHEKSSSNSRYAIRWGRRLSSWPLAIIYNSDVIRAEHVATGFADQRALVIHNGIPIEEFAGAENRRAACRAELGFAAADIVVGYLARLMPIKNHLGFFEAAALVHRERPNARFLIAGSGATIDNPDVSTVIDRLGLTGLVTCLGRRDDVANVFFATDIVASSSYGEGFPTAIAEAMASARPCVATDVGGTAMLIADNGIVVPEADSAALARGIVAMIDKSPQERRAIGLAAQKSVADRFSIDVIAPQYLALYRRLTGTSRG